MSERGARLVRQRGKMVDGSAVSWWLNPTMCRPNPGSHYQRYNQLVLEMVDVDLNSVPSVNLKIIFGVHFILITWGIQGHWSPDSYFFYNLVFILTLLWGVHCKDRVEPLQIAMVLDGVSVLLDIFAIGMNSPSIYAGEKFSVAMALVNLALRPISVVLLGRICADRMGLDDGFPARFGNLFGETEHRGPYEDIERGSGPSRQHQNVPSTETADFSPTYH